jgi:hypothetical protein
MATAADPANGSSSRAVSGRQQRHDGVREEPLAALVGDRVRRVGEPGQTAWLE